MQRFWRSRNIAILYATTFLSGLMFFLPILALYFQATLFTAQNVAIIFSAEAIAIAIFEVPTGAVADLFGRKNTMLISYILRVLVLVLLLMGGSMVVFLAYAILNAFAHALNSGADTALMYDTLKEEGQEKIYKKVSGIYMAIWPFGAAISAIIGGYMAAVSLRTPIFYTIFPYALASVLICFIVEPKHERKIGGTLKSHMFETARDVIKNKQLLIILLGGVVAWSFGESLHFLSQLFFQYKEIPIVLFGYITAASFALSSLGFYFSHNISEWIGNKKTVIISVALSGLFIILATLTSGYVMLIIFVLSSFFFGLRSPVLGHLWNEEIGSSKRATANSINSLVSQAGSAVALLLLGYWIDIFTASTAFLLGGLIMLFIPSMFFVFLKKN